MIQFMTLQQKLKDFFGGLFFLRPFSEKEFPQDKVIFYGQNLFAGTHSTSYTAIVNTNGSFVLPPTLVYDAFQPEIMGLSAAGIFTTKVMNGKIINDEESSECLLWKHRKLVRSGLPSTKMRDKEIATPQSQVEIPQTGGSSGSGIGAILGLFVGVVLLFSVDSFAIKKGLDFKFTQSQKQEQASMLGDVHNFET